MKLSFLGSANSAGIPVHNCTCEACSLYKKNKELNLATCAYLSIDEEIILLDAGHDNISDIFNEKKILAVFLTHFHADHCLGLLRLRHSKNKILCYHPKDKDGFSDLFKHKHNIEYSELNNKESVLIKNINFTALNLEHSKNTNGYLIQTKNIKIAYLTDCYTIKKDLIQFLKEKSLDYVFIDACYDERTKKGNHLNYLQASDILDEIKAKQSYLMHISHTTLEYILKNNIKLKYNYLKNNQEFIF